MPKLSAYASFISGKSFQSVRNTVTFTTRSRFPASSGFQDRPEILDHLPRLPLHAAGNEPTSSDRTPPVRHAEEKAPCPDGLRIGANGRRRLRARNSLRSPVLTLLSFRGERWRPACATVISEARFGTCPRQGRHPVLVAAAATVSPLPSPVALRGGSAAGATVPHTPRVPAHRRRLRLKSGEPARRHPRRCRTEEDRTCQGMPKP